MRYSHRHYRIDESEDAGKEIRDYLVDVFEEWGFEDYRICESGDIKIFTDEDFARQWAFKLVKDYAKAHGYRCKYETVSGLMVFDDSKFNIFTLITNSNFG